MSISRSVQEAMKGASWIRRMFEAGRVLKQTLGDDQVHDFSLGNPVLEPPETFQQALKDLVNDSPGGMHRYMPNNGFLSTRKAVAKQIGEEQEIEIDADDVVMTVGAAGAIHVTLHALLDPGDEVIVLAPYFVEYLHYVEVHRGVPVVVETDAQFNIDMAAIRAKICDRTKAIIINTPNNPTGRIYTQDQMRELAALLAEHEKEHGRPIYLMVDTPYAKITYDGKKNPLIFADHPSTVLVHSHSKDLGLAGERIGYLVVSPRAPSRVDIQGACKFSNRVLGYINAPALMQLALERSMGATVDTSSYREACGLLCDGLEAAGYDFVRPDGAFYLFPRCPIEDEVAFTAELRERNVLVVPGRGFGRRGHIRIAFCVTPETVTRAMPAFTDAINRAKR